MSEAKWQEVYKVQTAAITERDKRIAELEAERDKLRGLLGVAGCPNCDGSGSIAHQVGDSDWEQEQCQWCYEKHLALKEIDNE